VSARSSFIQKARNPERPAVFTRKIEIKRSLVQKYKDG
jgi:hypothetical protein